MPSWQQQALVEAPVEEVWKAVGDPREYPRWAADVVEVTGVAEVVPELRFQQVSKGIVGNVETTFQIEALEDMREIKLRCQKSGYYSRWVLTPAQESTFMDVEIGMDPTTIQYRLLSATVGKRHFRQIAEESLDGLRRLLAAGS